MRMTAKYKAALAVSRDAGINPALMTQEQLYDELAEKAYRWDKTRWYKIVLREWAKPKIALRVIAHPSVLGELVASIESALKKLVDIEDVSKPYPNHEDTGKRVYLTGRVKVKAKKS